LDKVIQNIWSNIDHTEKDKSVDDTGKDLWKILEGQIQQLFKLRSVKDLEQVRDLLFQQLGIWENDHSMYNLACVESLLKNEKSALSYLKRAIDLGYNNGAHMDKDSDLDFIRDTVIYKELREKVLPPPVKNEPQSQSNEIDFSRSLDLLFDMGLINRSENYRILKQTNGDIATALAILLASDNK